MSTTEAAALRRAAVWRVALGALLISFSPILVKRLVPDVMGPTSVGFYRLLFGGIALLCLAKVRGESLRMSKSLWILAGLAGLLFAMDIGSWHRAIPLIGAGLATLLANTQVVWVALVGAFLFKESGGWKLAVSVALSVVGVALVAGVLTPKGMPQADVAGVLLGLSTGVYYAGFILVLRRAQTRPGVSVVTFMAWASLATALFLGAGTALHDESFVIPTLEAWMCLLGLAIVVQAAAWTILSHNLPKIPAALGALLLLLQPIFATVWGALFFREQLTPFEIGGSALILAAIFLGSTASRPASVRSKSGT